MKRFTLYLILFSFAASSVKAQQTNTYTFTFTQNDFDFKIVDNQKYVIPKTSDFSFDHEVTAPAIPKKNVLILIAKDQTYVSHSFYKTSQRLSNTTELAPNPEVRPTNSSYSIKKTNVQNPPYPNSSYPSQNVLYNGEQEIEGYKVLSFTIIPFKYFTSNHYLYLYNSLSLSVTTAHVDSTSNNHSLLNKPFVRALAYNGNDIDLLYGDADPQPRPDYEYLIITNNYLKPAFQPLADWKTIKGVRTHILTMEEINSGWVYSAPTAVERIRNAIIDHDSGTYKGIKYLLLAGDKDIVPSLDCWIKCGKDTATITPSDMYYSSFHTIWDKNYDGVLGDSIDDFSLNPTLAVTRIPVTTIGEADAFVQRIIQYEQTPDTSNWTNSILMCGFRLSDDYPFVFKNDNGTIKSDTQKFGDDTYTNAIEGYWGGQRVRFYDTYSDVGDSLHLFNSYNLGTEIAKNYTFLNVDTHGNIPYWCLDKISNSPYAPEDKYLASTAYNSTIPIKSVIVTVSCLTNAFDSTEKCLSKGFMCNPHGGGALAYLGSSRNGLYNLLGYGSFTFNSYFYRNLFRHPTKKFGEIVRLTKQSIIDLISEQNRHNRACFGKDAYWYLCLSINPLGDPEMPIFTETPLSIEPNSVSLHFNENALCVTTTLDSVSICVTSLEDSGVTYFSKQENVSNAIFEGTLGSYNVCITKPGYIPFLKTVHNNLYIQNKQLSGNRSYEAEKVYIGKNVTTSESEGDVTINSNGNISINANETYIKNNFEVVFGGALTIGPK